MGKIKDVKYITNSDVRIRQCSEHEFQDQKNLCSDFGSAMFSFPRFGYPHLQNIKTGMRTDWVIYVEQLM
jgi:hypothetical protein